MQTVLIDTDVAIDFLRGEPYARDLLLPLWNLSRAYMSVLTIYELFADCLIASTALLQGHKIATRNIRHHPDKKLFLTLP